MKSMPRHLFNVVMKRGSLVHTPHLSLKKLSLPGEHVSVVVSRKVLASAVARNTLKRRIRAIAAESGIKDMHGIFFAKKGAGALSIADLKDEALGVLKKSRG
ncbi:hypothetical protein A3D62_02675 [Candidatus Kaiserbacteria bacterium RIFCSPHIGHO2_02_FULL_49_11]|uniref:Uncharacterized protein n=1 Tax=Candidatus Kaiserbacteria bacterium RIFCSPHIGHO2_02_FULL_49_11 TaxID=1798489 RepID=A0A1F6D192_9BACT|nr:MAG: hypothetical protein A3D62_02675 [Candidatus Kaiserbacteria bacterium RIFCSPHIGHO2_02_FULL_49_11]